MNECVGREGQSLGRLHNELDRLLTELPHTIRLISEQLYKGKQKNTQNFGAKSCHLKSKTTLLVRQKNSLTW